MRSGQGLPRFLQMVPGRGGHGGLLMDSVRPDFLDRLVSYGSPVAGARRMHARYCMVAANGFVAGARRMSGGHDGTLANWDPRRDPRLSESLSFDKAMVRGNRLPVTTAMPPAASTPWR